MDQMSFMAEVERADIVITVTNAGDGQVVGSTYLSTEVKDVVRARYLAQFLREYADNLEKLGFEDV